MKDFLLLMVAVICAATPKSAINQLSQSMNVHFLKASIPIKNDLMQ